MVTDKHSQFWFLFDNMMFDEDRARLAEIVQNVGGKVVAREDNRRKVDQAFNHPEQTEIRELYYSIADLRSSSDEN